MVSIAFEKTTLSNGLDVILHEDHSIPLVAVNVWYHVGSKDEELGRTGFAHLFEHVMFEGSKHHNRSHFEPLQRAGANLNGSTTMDRTNYWEDVPTNYLELALWLEADRMGYLLDALDQQRFDVQRDVVKNERRQTYENRPYGMAHWHIQEALFPLPHPYNWMTIGSQEDLDAASLDDVKDFFRRFYAPSNSSLAIAGDIDMGQTLELVNRFFGDLPPSAPVQRRGRHDSPLTGRVELEMQDKVSLPRLYIAWPTPPARDLWDAPLDLLRYIMADGLSSRLHRSLVYEKQMAQSVNIRYYGAEIAGQFIVDATAAPGHSLDEVEAAVDAELDRILHEPPTDEEMARAKNRLEAQHYRQLARIGGFGGRADDLNYFNVFTGNPDLINTSINDYTAVQREDILQARERVLGANQVRLRVVPEPALSPATVTLDRSVMPDPAQEPSFTPPIPERRSLSNGLGVAVLEKPGLPIVSFALMLPAGAITDPVDQPGLASFTAQMLSEGTETRSSQEIAAAFEFMGARISAETRREITLLSTETLTKHWTDALALMADLVLHPTFPQHELDRTRREHLTDLRRAKDEPTFVAEQVMAGLVFGRESRYGHPSIGTEASTTALTREDLVRHFQDHYGPAGATLAVVGDVTLEQVMDQAKAALGNWEAGLPQSNGQPQSIEEATETETTIYLVDKPGAAQSVIRAGHATVPRQHPDYFGLTLLNYSFGGNFSARLNQNLRQEKGYSYGYHSSVSWFREPSYMVAGGSVQTAVTKESVQETLKEFQEIHQDRPVTSEEIERAKAGMLRSYPANFERSGQIVGQIVQLVLHDLPNDYFRTISDQMAAVPLEEVHRVGDQQVRPDNLKVLVVGDRQEVEPGLRDLGLPVVLLDSDGIQVE